MDTSPTTEVLLNLDSRDSDLTPERGVSRFYIDGGLKNVRHIEWLAFETPQYNPQSVVIDAQCDTLYFSEDLQPFKATLPHGAYTHQSLPNALESAMACATSTDFGERPRNQYRAQVLPDSGRLAIRTTTRTTGGFVVHTFQGLLKIHSFRWMNGGREAQLTVLHNDQPVGRGNIMDLFRPSLSPMRVQVLHALRNMLLVRIVGTATNHDVNVVVEEWTLRPVATDTLLPQMLGLGDYDMQSSRPMNVISCSNPFDSSLNVAIREKRMHLGLSGPHGCVKGDVVTLDGFQGGGIFMNGQKAAIVEVISEQQLILQIDASSLGAFPPHQPLQCVFPPQHVPVNIAVGKVLRVEAHDNTVIVTFEKKESNEFTQKGPWKPVRLLGPVPWRGWSEDNRIFFKAHGNEIMLRYAVHVDIHAGTSSMQRSAVVGLSKVNLQRPSVLLMRLRLGRTEAGGVLTLKKNNMHVFGRVQRMFGPESLVGKSTFDPPLEKVPYVEVCFLTSQGEVVFPHMVGDFSLLLRCMASC